MNTRRNKRQLESDPEPTIERASIDSREPAEVVINHEEQWGVLDTSSPKVTRDAFDSLLDKSSPKLDGDRVDGLIDKSSPKGAFEEIKVTVVGDQVDSLQECTISKSTEAEVTPSVDRVSPATIDPAGDTADEWIFIEGNSAVGAVDTVDGIEPPADSVLVGDEVLTEFDVAGADLVDDLIDG